MEEHREDEAIADLEDGAEVERARWVHLPPRDHEV